MKRNLFVVIAIFVLLEVTPVCAQTVSSAGKGFWADWFQRSDKAKEEQPRWITPLATTTPRLEQEFRYDILWQQARPGAKYTRNFGNSKGLELIPFDKIEIIVGIPPYIIHNNLTEALRVGTISKRIVVEVEVNATFFRDGKNDRKKQVLITPGLVVGRVPLTSRLGLTLGAGLQNVVSEFHTTEHNFILSIRLPF